MKLSTLLTIAALAIIPVHEAHAHTTVGIAGGFLSGFEHPIFGLDHLVAMVAVGLWGAFLGMPAIWILPITFPIVMAMGKTGDSGWFRADAATAAVRELVSRMLP